MNNSEIAELFELLSKLMDIHGENAFKAKTYSIAAYHIDRLPMPLSSTKREQVAGIRGIGSSIATKIFQILDTGSLDLLQQYLDETPQGVLEMLQIKGLGPKKIHVIWKEMGIGSVGELEYACIENRLTRYKGFGEKTQQNVLQALRFYNQNKGYFLYAQIEQIVPMVQQYLEKLFGKAHVLNTGQFRRQLPTIKELEFVIEEANNNIKPKFATAYPPQLLEETENQLLYKLTNGARLRLYTGKKNRLTQQFLTSASEEFLEGFFENEDLELFEKQIVQSEEEIFNDRKMSYIPPCLRETKEIIAKAKNGTLPELIQVSDVKGAIHNHSNWSDGNNTIEELAHALIDKGFEYLVISDHSKSAAYANGLSEERVLQQHQYIDELNRKLSSFKIYKCIESDILNDGSLDYEDELLKRFDLVIASIHSNLYMQEEKAMMRLLKAIENPFTTILGHPTGRLLLSREGYPVQHKRIIDACAANHVVVEVNANPHRLDLDWSWIEYAMSKNVLLSVNPDAHSIEGLEDIRYGVLASQKGGLTAAYNLSSFSRTAFETFILEQKRMKQS